MNFNDGRRRALANKCYNKSSAQNAPVIPSVYYGAKVDARQDGPVSAVSVQVC